MIHLDVGVLGEGDAVEPCGQREDALLHAVEREVGAQHLRVEVVARLAQLVAVVGEIPGLQLEIPASGLHLFAGEVFYLFDLLAGFGHIGLQQLLHQSVHVFRVLGHTLFQRKVGVAFEAQHPGYFAAQVDDLAHNLQVVPLARGAQCGHSAINFLAEVAPVGVLEEGGVGGALERHHPSFQPATPGLHRCCFEGAFGQSADFLLCRQMQGEGVGGMQLVLRELQREHAQFPALLGQYFLLLFGQQGAAAGEALVGVVEQFLLLRRELAPGVVVHGFDALKQACVHCDARCVLREQGLHLLREGFHLVGATGREQVEEYAGGAREQPLAACQHRVVEGWFVGVGNDALDLGVLLLHALRHRLFVFLEADAREGNAVVGCVVFVFYEYVSH